MSKVRLHLAETLTQGGVVETGPDRAHYLGAVLRMGSGDALRVFNAVDGEFAAVIEEIGRRRCTIRLHARTRVPAPEPDLWLVFAPIKRARIDFLAGKATELGVSALWPVYTARTNVARVGLERLRANAAEAAAQCGRLSVPEVFAPASLEAVLAGWPDARRLYWCDETGRGRAAARVFDHGAPGPAAVLVGPEGGFAEDERARLRAHRRVAAIDLGPRLMRTETAAFAALACWQALRGDWAGGSAADDAIALG